MLELEPFTMNYSGANAYALADACMSLALAKSDAFQEKAGKWITKRIPSQEARYNSVERKGPQALIATSDDAIVVVFHDSEDWPLRDWMSSPSNPMFSPNNQLTRFSARMDPHVPPLASEEWPIGDLNQYLQMRFQPIWAEASSSLRTPRRRSIFLTGHGLGGAYALLAALTLRSSDQIVHGVYTFGQPRVLGRSLAFWLNLDFGAHIFRVVNNNDLVTLCPLRRDGYGHAGTLVFFDEAGQVHSDSYWWFRLLSDFDESAENDLPRLLEVPPSGVRDHLIERYVELTLRHRDHGLRP